jgi:hypothetical protein
MARIYSPSEDKSAAGLGLGSARIAIAATRRREKSLVGRCTPGHWGECGARGRRCKPLSGGSGNLCTAIFKART